MEKKGVVIKAPLFSIGIKTEQSRPENPGVVMRLIWDRRQKKMIKVFEKKEVKGDG